MKKINLRKNCLLQNIFISLDNKQIKRGEYYSSLFYCQIAKLSFVLAKSDDLDVMDKNKVLKVILIWLQLDGSHTRCRQKGESTGYQARKKSVTTNSIFLCDNKGQMIAMGSILM